MREAEGAPQEGGWSEDTEHCQGAARPMGAGALLWHGLESLKTRVHSVTGRDHCWGEEGAIRKNRHLGSLLLPLHTAHTPLSTGYTTALAHSPHVSAGALDSVKSFQSHFLFLNLSQYKPCSKCYEKMYMFIQGRLWQDTGGSPPQEAPGGGAGGAGVLVSGSSPPATLPTPSPGTSSALPRVECTHTRPRGSSR